MLCSIVMTNEEDENAVLNNDNTEINKGVELLLRNRRKKPRPKAFQVEFSFFKWEITFYLDIKKK